MGSDVAWFRVYQGARPGARRAALDAARAALEDAGYRPADAPADPDEYPTDRRGLVAVEDGAWVQLGDQAESTMYQGCYPPPRRDQMAAALSRVGPVVAQVLSDDVVLHLELWDDGARRARYGTMRLDWRLFTAAEARGQFHGAPGEWAARLPGVDAARLAALFEHTEVARERAEGWRGRPAFEVLRGVSEMLGWSGELLQAGFSHDSDGIFIPWDEYYEPEVLARHEFEGAWFAPPVAGEADAGAAVAGSGRRGD